MSKGMGMSSYILSSPDYLLDDVESIRYALGYDDAYLNVSIGAGGQNAASEAYKMGYVDGLAAREEEGR